MAEYRDCPCPEWTRHMEEGCVANWAEMTLFFIVSQLNGIYCILLKPVGFHGRFTMEIRVVYEFLCLSETPRPRVTPARP